jgi:hydrogenase maturation protease
MSSDAKIVVVCIGNRYRGDDAAGLAVAERVRAQAPADVSVTVFEEEPTRLIDAFADADVALVVDAVSTGAPVGTVHRFDASDAALPSRDFRSSTHALGISDAVELARALGRLPARTLVFGVEGCAFPAREGMSPAVSDAVERAAAAVLEEVAGCTSRR